MTVDELDRLAAEKAVKRLIETKVIKASYGSCWLWTGYVGWHGYGQYRLKNKSYKIHRLFYETLRARSTRKQEKQVNATAEHVN